MAEATGQERTEQPTEKRLNEARKKGQVARSRELTTTVTLLASAAALLVTGSWIIEALLSVMQQSFSFGRAQAFDPFFGILTFRESVSLMLMTLAPLFTTIAISAVLGNVAMSGWNFSPESIALKPEKLNPIDGIKKIAGPQGLMEAGKAVAKFLLVSVVGVAFLWSVTDKLLGLGAESLRPGMAHAGELILWGFLAVSSIMILVAVVDIPFQAWNHKKQLKMTKQEVKQESKETDGNPELKRKVRQTQMDMAMRRMMQEVPKADVIITNPTHFSVAIRYDQKKMRAPVVIAKGQDNVAMEIRRIALENDVPLLSAPPLARAIHHSTKLNHAIPEGLYVAVAQILAYIFQLRQQRKQHKSDHFEKSDLPIPDELKKDPGETPSF